MTVIAIAHERGSGGREIGQLVARRLGLTYVDHEIVQRVAQVLQVSEDLALWHDEHVVSRVQGLLRTLSPLAPLAAGLPPLDRMYLMSDQEYNHVTRTVIEAAARTNLVMIAGHGANFALAGRQGVLRVLLYAPLDQRIAAVMRRWRVIRRWPTSRSIC
jgi:cytidylate kinase